MTDDRRGRMTPDERHAHHHRLIAERVAEYRAMPVRQRSRRIRSEAYKKAHNTLAGHLRSEHGWRRMIGAPLPLDRLEEIHAGYHHEKVTPSR